MKAISSINDDCEEDYVTTLRGGDATVVILVAICVIFYFAMVCTQSTIAAAIFAAISLTAWLLVFAMRRELLGWRWKLLLFMYGRAMVRRVAVGDHHGEDEALMSNCDALAIGTSGITPLQPMQHHTQHLPNNHHHHRHNNESQLRVVLLSNQLLSIVSRSPHLSPGRTPIRTPPQNRSPTGSGKGQRRNQSSNILAMLGPDVEQGQGQGQTQGQGQIQGQGITGLFRYVTHGL